MMLLWTTLKISLGSLAANKLRSVLSMLGVIIGVAAVIAMLGLGNAFGTYIRQQISWLGTNLLYVRAGAGRQMGPMSLVQTLTPEDAEAIISIEGVRAASPMSVTSAQTKAGGRNSDTAVVVGVAPSYVNMYNLPLTSGRMFLDGEVRRQARAAVLGPKAAADLFGAADPVGRDVKIHGMSFRVLGVTKALGDQGGFNPDDRILIPYTTAMRQLPPRRDYIQVALVEVDDQKDIAAVTAAISKLLRQRHRLRAGESDDFVIQSGAQILETFQAVSVGITAFLGIVAAISLVVGGIGIMNIMLATVAERTREIGIRKALGARDRDIMRQFLIETLVITLGGGMLGMLLGWGLMAAGSAAVRQWVALSPALQGWVVGMSIAISTTVGLGSGLYPAWRASRLDPVEALRYD